MKENCGKYVIGKIQKKILYSEPELKIHRNKNKKNRKSRKLSWTRL